LSNDLRKILNNERTVRVRNRVRVSPWQNKRQRQQFRASNIIARQERTKAQRRSECNAQVGKATAKTRQKILVYDKNNRTGKKPKGKTGQRQKKRRTKASQS
jgi:hypothetical protein